MKFITRNTDYALRALIYMARAFKKTGKKIFTVDEISDKEDLPERFLRKILQILAKKKILYSHKGKFGGFSFMAPPAEISLGDVIAIFQGDIDLTNCLLKGRICPNKSVCKVRKKIKAINLSVINGLNGIKVSSL